MSISALIVGLLYSYARINILINYEDTTYISLNSRRQNIEETKLNIAFTLANSQRWQPHEVNETGYIEWDIFYWQWEPIYDPEDETKVIDSDLQVERIPFERCTQEDRNTGFFEKENEDNALLIRDYFPFMYCLTQPDKLKLQGWLGQYLPGHGKVFSISVRRCEGSSECKSKEEIDQFIDNHRLYIQYNQQTYNDYNFGDEEVIADRVEGAYFPLR